MIFDHRLLVSFRVTTILLKCQASSPQFVVPNPTDVHSPIVLHHLPNVLALPLDRPNIRLLSRRLMSTEMTMAAPAPAQRSARAVSSTLPASKEWLVNKFFKIGQQRL